MLRWRTLLLAAASLIAIAVLMPLAPDAFGELIAGIRYEEETTSLLPVATPESDSVAQQIITVADAIETYRIDLPSWAPTGYLLESDNVVATDWGDETYIQVFWSNSSNERIVLSVFHNPTTYTWAVGNSSVEQTEINGQEVAVVTGSWDYASDTWDPGSTLHLQWTDNGHIYSLTGKISQEAELTHMAQTMDHFQ